eukprot:Partr_v1_DN28663_c0_g1_i3_m49702 putative NA
MDSLADFLHRLVAEPLGDFVKFISHPQLPDEPDWKTSVFGSWYLSPAQHGVEFVVFNVIIISAAIYFLRGSMTENAALNRYLKERQSAEALDKSESPSHRLFIRICESAILVTTWTTMLTLLWYKSQRQLLLFLFQPCHVNTFAYAILFMLDPLTPLPHVIFNVMLHLNWGVVLALLQPDTRDYTMMFEVEFFWIEHWLLMLIPLYCIVTRKYFVFDLTASFAAGSFFLKAAYHSIFMAPIALVSGINLNYLLAPPPGPLVIFGRMYRVAMYLASFLMTLIIRYAVWYPVDRLSARFFPDGIHFPRPKEQAAHGTKTKNKKKTR